mmetsp:Transcript_27653/g.30771  ORF Transcript_27653/g.30771 Transcript_27653/m.30771 type:complete len:190 (+) Transcript_27653:59-628(+)
MISYVKKCYSDYRIKDWPILVTGQDYAGKTTAVHQMVRGEYVTVPSTRWLPNYEVKRSYARKPFQVYEWDSCDKDKLQPLYNSYYNKFKALVYVVDSTNIDIMAEDALYFQKLLRNDHLNDDIPILIMANKQDLPTALSLKEISDKYGLESLKRPWHIIATCALRENGLEESLEWLADQLDIWKNEQDV